MASVSVSQRTSRWAGPRTFRPDGDEPAPEGLGQLGSAGVILVLGEEIQIADQLDRVGAAGLFLGLDGPGQQLDRLLGHLAFLEDLGLGQDLVAIGSRS